MLASATDLVELCRLLHATVARTMDATIFFLAVYDAASETVEVVWQTEHGVELPGGSFPLGSGLTSQVLTSGRPRLIRRWSMEGPPVQVQYATGTPGLPESAIAVPLRQRGSVIGLVTVETYTPDAYSDEDLGRLQALADEAAGTIARLHESQHLGAQLRGRVSELEAILANMADALVIIDDHGRLVRLNRVARELLCPDDSSIVLGQPFDKRQWELWPADARAVAEALGPVVDKLQQTGEPVELEVDLVGPAHRTLSFRASPLHDARGAYSGGVIVFTDVTGRREMERFKDDMLSMASHDLKTPTTVIKAQAQLLMRRVRARLHTNEELEESLSVVTDQADRLTMLVNLLLDLSRIESGRLELDLAPTDLRGVLISMARAIQLTAPRHHIDVKAPRGVVGHWDQHRVEEVVQNLIGNAVKYTPRGGTIEVRLVTDARNAVVTVRDHGVGLAPEEVPRVFERFYRGHDIRRLEGTGLGLYICQAIIKAHGGRIWAESDGLGQGSTFGFSLPLRD